MCTPKEAWRPGELVTSVTTADLFCGPTLFSHRYQSTQHYTNSSINLHTHPQCYSKF